MENNDKQFWGSRERRKHFSGSREHELKTFSATRGFINGEQGIKSKNIKGSWEHVPPPPGRGSTMCEISSLLTDGRVLTGGSLFSELFGSTIIL